MKKNQLVQLIREALTDKVKAVSVPASKLQKGDTMAADKAKITSVKKDGDNIEVTISGGKKLNFKKDKQVQIVRAGSTLKESFEDEFLIDEVLSGLITQALTAIEHFKERVGGEGSQYDYNMYHDVEVALEIAEEALHRVN